jgi:hypothetical protein
MVCPDGAEQNRRLDTRALGGPDAVHVVKASTGVRSRKMRTTMTLRGQTMAEYAVILSVISVLVVGSFLLLVAPSTP